MTICLNMIYSVFTAGLGARLFTRRHSKAAVVFTKWVLVSSYPGDKYCGKNYHTGVNREYEIQL